MSDKLAEDHQLTEAMESAMRECLSLKGSKWGYRFRQATMRRCEAAGWAKRKGNQKRPAWELTGAGEARLRMHR